MRSTWLLLLLLLGTTLSAAPVFAEPVVRASKSRKPKAMVLQPAVDERVRPAVRDALQNSLSAALRDRGFDVVSSTDIAAALGLERQKQLVGCTDSNCLAEIGGALGVDFMVLSQVGGLDNDTLLVLKLIDPGGRVKSLQRKQLQGQSERELVTSAEQLVTPLVAEVKGAKAAGGLVASRDEPRSTARTVVGFGGLGLGAALGIGAAVTGVMASLSEGEATTASQTDGGDVASPHAKARTLAWVSTGLTAGAVAAGTAGLVALLTGDGEAKP